MAEANAVADDQVIPPSSNEPQTESEAAKDIANLLSDDLTVTPDPAHADEDKDADEDDPLGLTESDDVEEDEEPDEPAGSPDKTTAGKYVSPNAKYKLEDGTEITIAELARNNLFQRDYSQKTEAVARKSEQLTAKEAAVDKTAQSLNEERRFLVWYAEQNVPQPPKPPEIPSTVDPLAHLQYAEDKRKYDAKYQALAQGYHQFKSQLDAAEKQKTDQTNAAAAEKAKTEVGALFEKIPMLKDSKKAESFFGALLTEGTKYYGLTQDELVNLAKQDHRNILVLRDAIAHRKNMTKAPAVQKEIAAKPRTVRGSAQRQTQSDTQRRALRNVTERLRQTGSMQDGIAAIESLI